MIDGLGAFWAGHVCMENIHGVRLAMALVARYPWQIEGAYTGSLQAMLCHFALPLDPRFTCFRGLNRIQQNVNTT